MALDPKFQKFTTVSPRLVSYDFTDIDGTGVITLYLSEAATSAGSTFVMSQNPIASVGAAAARTLPDAADNDFDWDPFNITQTVRGTAHLSGEFITGGSSNVAVTIYKWDGSTETAISSRIVSQTTSVNGAAFNIPIPLTETVFPVGEQLRARIEFDGSGSTLPIDPISDAGLLPLILLMPFAQDT